MRINHETRYKMFHKKDQAALVRLFLLAKMLTDFLLCLLKKESRDIPGGPVVKTALLLLGAWDQSLVRELRSHPSKKSHFGSNK